MNVQFEIDRKDPPIEKEVLNFPGPEKYTNRLLASDVETNGLLEKVTKMWCIVSQDVESKEMFIFHDFPEYNNKIIIDEDDDLEYTIPARTGTLEEGAQFWKLASDNGSKLIVHNAGGFDSVILDRFYPQYLVNKSAYVDTFIQSKLQWFDRGTPKGARGPHGLQAYGCRLGVNKPDVTDWEEMNGFKLHRGIQDVKIQRRTFGYLEREHEMVLKKLGIDLKAPWIMENEYRKNVTEQELNGALVDEDHIDKCIIDLDEKIETLRVKIEPRLPPTLTKKGVKISKGEMAELFYGKKNYPEDYELVKVDGEMVRKVVKQYYKPSTNFHRTEKTNQYSGFELSCGESPSFVKKKDLRDWIIENFPDTVPKSWDIQKEIVEVEKLNKNTCDYFDVDEDDTDYIAGPHTRIEFNSSTMSQSEVVKVFLISLGWKDSEEWNLKKDSDGMFVKAEHAIEVRWPPYAEAHNQIVKKVKRGETIVTTPKLSDDDYEKLPPGLGEDISHFNTYNHRRRFLSNPKDPENKGIKAHIRSNGRIPCGVNTFNTSTGRSSHSLWVNAPGEGALYGEEIRKIIIAPEGRKLVGVDMASAQLAICAYYAKNYEYYEAVASGDHVGKDENGEEYYIGESAHCFSARLFDIVSQEEWKEAVKNQDPELLHSIMLRRKKSKSASFGVVFGCSGKKLAGMLGVPEAEGNSKKEAFLTQMGLKKVQQWLEGCHSKYKRAGGWYIPLPMGYWVYCKSAHKSLNYIVQGTESVAQKLAVNYFEKKVKELNIDAIKILDYQDEVLLEASVKDAEKTGELMCEAYRYASDKIYEWHCDNPDKFPNHGGPSFAFNLDGGSKLSLEGNKGNYLQTH